MQDESKRRYFTSESVTEGHPDKICDQISDAILDDIIRQDPRARVACETACTTGMVLVMGEISTHAYVDIPSVVRKTVQEIGYDGRDSGFDYRTCAVLTSIDEQSPDIACGVDHSLEARSGLSDDDDLGAGDQGMVFGFANTDTKDLMPLPIHLAHALTCRLAQVRRTSAGKMLRPDGKSQVTVEYDQSRPVRIDAVVISTQHASDMSHEELTELVKREVILPVLPKEMVDDKTRYFINPTGRFVIGGPQGDCGLTGRKVIADTYGGFARHGGGAFSGKDPTKIDRSAAYMARYIAKNIVAAKIADACEIQISYAIGVAEPVSVMVETFGTGRLSDTKIIGLIRDCFDLRPAAIIDTLRLRRPIYKKTSVYGHFGRRDPDFSWEQTDRADELRKKAGL